MNNRQLQEAIDSARNFIALTGTQSGPLWEARAKTKLSLVELEKIQVIRAGLMIKPSVQMEGK
jgi:hypothetical protein